MLQFFKIEEVILDFWHQSRSLFQNCIFLSNRIVCILLGCIMECPWCTLNGYKFKSHHSRYQSKPNLYAHVFLIFLFKKTINIETIPPLFFNFLYFCQCANNLIIYYTTYKSIHNHIRIVAILEYKFQINVIFCVFNTKHIQKSFIWLIKKIDATNYLDFVCL